MTSSEKSPLLSSRRSMSASRKPVLVIHGGAGAITREGSTPERREMYKEALRKALLRGYRVLQAGGEAMDAAVAAVTVMEGEYTVIIFHQLLICRRSSKPKTMPTLDDHIEDIHYLLQRADQNVGGRHYSQTNGDIGTQLPLWIFTGCRIHNRISVC